MIVKSAPETATPFEVLAHNLPPTSAQMVQS
jgi:hypothetical protein